MTTMMTAATDWVPAGPFRSHLRHLMDASTLPWRAIAIHVGVAPAAVQSLLFGRRGKAVHRVAPATAERLLRATPATLRQTRFSSLDAEPVARRARLLLGSGLATAEVAGMLHVTVPEVRDLAGGTVSRCSVRTALLAQAACEALGLLTASIETAETLRAA